jgi:hypothetical protein
MILAASTFITGCFTSFGFLSIICFGFSQLLVGWMGHSMSHSRDPVLMKIGGYFSALVGGFCL